MKTTKEYNYKEEMVNDPDLMSDEQEQLYYSWMATDSWLRRTREKIQIFIEAQDDPELKELVRAILGHLRDETVPIAKLARDRLAELYRSKYGVAPKRPKAGPDESQRAEARYKAKQRRVL